MLPQSGCTGGASGHGTHTQLLFDGGSAGGASVHALLGEAVERALEALPLLPGGRGVRRRLQTTTQELMAHAKIS